MSQIITRFAPSPTGHLHIGGARTALFNWLLARSLGGRFILRIEDTDAQRSKEEYTEAILEAMRWLSLDWDGELVFQSKRVDRHREAINTLIEQKKAYWCHCTPEELEQRRNDALAAGAKPKYDGRCRDLDLGYKEGAVVRFKGPLEGQTGWRDLVKGEIIFDNQELDDLIILKSDGMPTYNMAVVVDDVDMGITHIVRGDDHVNNTPRQILLYHALGAELPEFGHVPMILGADKARLSKRHGATSVMAYKEMGYLPEALLNYLARLGWSYGDREIFSLEDLKEVFTLDNVGRSPGVFNPEKLLWLNSHYIKETPDKKLADLVKPYLISKGYSLNEEEFLVKAVNTVKERGKTLVELAEKAEFYFQDVPVIEAKAGQKFLNSENKLILSELLPKLLPVEDLTHESLESLLRDFAAEKDLKLGAIAQPLRVALSGQTASPGLFEMLVALGSEKTSSRIKSFVNKV